MTKWIAGPVTNAERRLGTLSAIAGVTAALAHGRVAVPETALVAVAAAASVGLGWVCVRREVRARRREDDQGARQKASQDRLARSWEREFER